jgi:hypothetical protein
VVLLRKSFPQKTNLQTAAELGVTVKREPENYSFGKIEKAKAVNFEE